MVRNNFHGEWNDVITPYLPQLFIDNYQEMYINAIGYHCESEDNCFKSNIKQDFWKKPKVFVVMQ